MNDKAPRAVEKMTRKEAEIKLDLYKEIFSVVQDVYKRQGVHYADGTFV